MPPTRSPMSSSNSQPLAGRKLWIAGIGGAGMSGYALVAQAWGADVAGWDRVRTGYLDHLAGVDVTIAEEPPAPPAGWGGYISTPYAGPGGGRPRAAPPAERVPPGRAIVV